MFLQFGQMHGDRAGQGPLAMLGSLPSAEQETQPPATAANFLNTALHTRTHYVCFKFHRSLRFFTIGVTYFVLPSSRIWTGTLGPLGAWFNAADGTLLCSAMLSREEWRSSRVGGGELGSGEILLCAAKLCTAEREQCSRGGSQPTLRPSCFTKCRGAEWRGDQCDASGEEGSRDPRPLPTAHLQISITAPH